MQNEALVISDGGYLPSMQAIKKNEEKINIDDTFSTIDNKIDEFMTLTNEITGFVNYDISTI